MEKEAKTKTISDVLQFIRAIQEETKHIKECRGCVDGQIEVEVDLGDGEKQTAWWPCPCMTQKCQHGKRLYSEYIDQVKGLILQIGIPKVHIKNFSKPQKTTAFVVADTWDAKGFLVLTGDTATGKSFAAAWAAKRYAVRSFEPDAWKNPSRRSEGIARARSSIAWTHAYDLVNEQTEKDRAKRVPFLVIDDLGAEDATSRAKSLVNRIISARYDEQLPTVITTNLTTAEISTRYGERLMDRIMHFGQVVRCDDCDMRAEVEIR
jgi:DNA replication protein DnaC